MQIIIKNINMEIEESLKKYIEKKFSSLSRFLKGGPRLQNTNLDIRITKTTEHHRNYDRLYLVECSVDVAKKQVRIEQYSDNIRSAIDLAKDRLKRAITEETDRLKE